jgi:alpha-galactosidase
MAMNCWAYYAASPHKRIVGLCHSIQNTSRQIAEYVGVPPDEVTFLGAGVNHMSWVLRLERDGEDLYPLLDRAIAADPEGLGHHVRVQIYKLFGYFPTESSEHFAEYVPWFMRDEAEIARLRIPVGEYVRRSEENQGIYAEEKRMLAAGEPFEIERSQEYASLIVHSVMTGEQRAIYGNVRNTGLITNLPADACVEVPCLVDRAGVQPTVVGELPPQCAALDRTFLNVVELAVRGALEERRDHVLQAVTLDPNAAATLSLEEMRAMVDELLAAHRDALPAGLR